MPKLTAIPDCPGPPSSRASGRLTKDCSIALITPLFGGGAEAGVPDETLPIRGTSIRGHLQFWWRAAVGHRLGDQMWQREEEIFGSTEFPSPLSVRIVDQPQVRLVDPLSYRSSPIAYALFAAIENKQQVVKEGLEFRLRLDWESAEGLQSLRGAQNKRRAHDRKPPLPDTIEDISVDITTALEVWCAFGGIGARSRRGCGAISCREMTRALPPIPGVTFVGAPQKNPLEAWKESVKAYRDFRQSPRGRDHQKTISARDGTKTIQVPGRSHWPEADSIRRLTGSVLRPAKDLSSAGIPADEDTQDHSVPVVPENLLPAFPRAILGMPINFHFADGPGKNQPGQINKDPKDVQLVPVLPDFADRADRADRMYSPIITRPIWYEGKWYPGVIIFEPNIPRGLRLRLTGGRAKAGGADLTCDLSFERVVNPSFSALQPMRNHASALAAFRDFLKSKGFREVAR